MADIGRFLRDFAIGATPTSDYFARKEAFEREKGYEEQLREQDMRNKLLGSFVSGYMLPEATAERGMQRSITLANIQDALNRGLEQFRTEERVRGTKLETPELLKRKREGLLMEREAAGGAWGEPTYREVTGRKFADLQGERGKGGLDLKDLLGIQSLMLTIEGKQRQLAEDSDKLTPDRANQLKSLTSIVSGVFQNADIWTKAEEDTPEKALNNRIKSSLEATDIVENFNNQLLADQFYEEKDITNAVDRAMRVNSSELLKRLLDKHGLTAFGYEVVQHYFDLLPEEEVGVIVNKIMTNEQRKEWDAWLRGQSEK